MSTCKQGVIGV